MLDRTKGSQSRLKGWKKWLQKCIWFIIFQRVYISLVVLNTNKSNFLDRIPFFLSEQTSIVTVIVLLHGGNRYHQNYKQKLLAIIIQSIVWILLFMNIWYNRRLVWILLFMNIWYNRRLVWTLLFMNLWYNRRLVWI